MFKYGDIHFKAPMEEDLSFLLEMRYDESNIENLFNVFPISNIGQNEWLKTMLSSQKNKSCIVYRNDTRIGCARLRDIDFMNQRVEIGASIIPSARGLGNGEKLFNALIEYCFTYLNMNKVYLQVFEDNRAVKLYERLGFEVEGRLKNHFYRNGFKTILIMSKFKDGTL